MGEGIGILAAAVNTTLGGLAVGVTRYVIAATDPITLAALRFGIGGLLLLPLALLRPARWPGRRDLPGAIGLGLLYFALYPVPRGRLRAEPVTPRWNHRAAWYSSAMTRNQVKAILDRVLTWPRERQEDAAALLALIEEHDKSPYRLTDEQAAEVRARQADRTAPTVTLGELDERLRRLGV